MDVNKIQYNVPIQIGFGTYVFLRRQFSGLIATQEIDGNFFVKIWMMKYASEIAKYIDELPTHTTLL